MVLIAKVKKIDYVTLVIVTGVGWPPMVYHMRDHWIGMSVRAAVGQARRDYYGKLPVRLNGKSVSSKDATTKLKVGDKLTLGK